jgi:hypothetical protein
MSVMIVAECYRDAAVNQCLEIWDGRWSTKHRQSTVGWLACDSGVSVTTAIAGKPAPTLIAFQIQ